LAGKARARRSRCQVPGDSARHGSERRTRERRAGGSLRRRRSSG